VNKAIRARKSVIAGRFIAKIAPIVGPESLPNPQAAVLTAR
jgi:hypothetical protein